MISRPSMSDVCNARSSDRKNLLLQLEAGHPLRLETARDQDLVNGQLRRRKSTSFVWSQTLYRSQHHLPSWLTATAHLRAARAVPTPPLCRRASTLGLRHPSLIPRWILTLLAWIVRYTSRRSRLCLICPSQLWHRRARVPIALSSYYPTRSASTNYASCRTVAPTRSGRAPAAVCGNACSALRPKPIFTTIFYLFILTLFSIFTFRTKHQVGIYTIREARWPFSANRTKAYTGVFFPSALSQHH
jgi:hypothetical protein